MVTVGSTMLPLGTEAPGFALPDPAGKLWMLDDVAGEAGTLVAFVCNHCPYVRHVAPRLGVTAAGWIAAGIGVIGVNSNDTNSYPEDRPERMVSQAAEWNWTFPYVSDEDQSAARTYRAACTPDFFLFDAGRRLAYRGRFDAARPRQPTPVTGAELDAAVRAVLAGEPVTGDQVPSIGCNIKWKPGNEPAWFG
ncbi:MAG: thioredoxin family protein [Labedaea sp.]